MSVRINQEPILIGDLKGLTSAGGNVRVNQEVLEVAVKSGVSGGNVRVNQEIILMLVPVVSQGSKVQIIGGPFQDALGNPISNGYLLFQLQHDCTVLGGAGHVVGNAAVRVPLDINGNIQGTVVGSPIFIWPNNLMSPSTNYLIWAYDASNRLVWDNPQSQQVLSSPSPFNINAWVPGP